MEYNNDIDDDICTYTLINELNRRIQSLNDQTFTEITKAVMSDNEKKKKKYF